MNASAFHELEIPNADELVIKSRLTRFVAAEITRRGLTQKAAGVVLGLDQSNVSALMNGKISRFSLDKLMSLADRLGFEISLHISGGDSKLDLPYRNRKDAA